MATLLLYYLCPVGTGEGTGGSRGNDCMRTPNSPEGQGMDTTIYNACLKITKLHNLTAGSGGLGGQAYNYTNGGGTHA